ncbi:MAG: nitrate- and nitrite sensing domain-containing protein [Arcobacteraceae bacterium]|nr:nitrate- and nitrite sensing domain-containing protein [Arcobacteraceae bacterium]
MYLKLKPKLLFLSFLPISFILILFTLILINMFESKENLQTVKRHIIEAKAISRIIHCMQIERGLSATSVSFMDTKIEGLLEESRADLNRSIEDYNYMLSLLEHNNIDFFSNDFNEVIKYRTQIDTLKVKSEDIIAFYSLKIQKLQNRIKVIPSIMDDKENSTSLRAYDYVLNAKESLGKIRALLSEGFANRIDTHTLQTLVAYLEVYKQNSYNFQTIVSKNILTFYDTIFNDKAIEKTFGIIENVLNDSSYKTNSLLWFDESTKAINLLNKVEKEIFNNVTASINTKINFMSYKITTLLLFLGITLVSIALLMMNISKKILSSTNKLEQSYEESLQLLEQYKATVDKSFIVSKTDPKGIITYVNQEFCTISGYNQEELLGKAHNIIRHPDMPKEVFKQMWHTIKELKKPWRGEVKNLKKDGGAYWVKAIVNPILNAENEIIEYISIRTDFTEVIELHLELEETQREIIYKMGEIGETRSRETGNHVKRVAYYSKLLATLYGLTQKEAQTLFMASPMHDIGKVGIPDSILNKAGQLTKEEFDLIKSHTTLGYNILHSSKRDILRTAAIVAYEHHEKYDGTGYPRGLKKDEIHIFGRITAVADVFDALGHDRVYKKAWELEDILTFFKKERGKHFDPVLVDLLFDNLEEFLKIKMQLEDIVPS